MTPPAAAASLRVAAFDQGRVDAWWDLTRDYRDAEPLLTNVLSSVATGVRGGRYDAARLWAVLDTSSDPNGAVVGAALQTPPHPLLLGPMSTEAAEQLAATVLTATLLVADPSQLAAAVPGASGPAAPVDAFAATVAVASGATVQPLRRELLRVLHDYCPPTGVPGAARRASAESEADIAAATDFMGAFHREVGQAGDEGESEYAERMHRAALERLRLGGWWWWEVDGVPVAAAAHAPLVDIGAHGVDGPGSPGRPGRVGRVGPVWTAPEHRRQGYAAAVTAAVTEALLGECSVVMLYTDADNATSNGVYARLGYEVEAELVAVSLQS